MKNINKFSFTFVILSFVLMFSVAFSSGAFAGQWVVKSGDSLSRIAANYPGVTAGEICSANTFMFKVKGCNHIEPGWNLVIPKVGDCFDAKMTTASKQKIIDGWNKKVVSDYKDGKPDCNFAELSKKPISSVAPQIAKLTNRIDILSNTLDKHVNSKMNILTFAILGKGGMVGVGGLFEFPSGYTFSYQFSGNRNGYTNQLLFGKYLTKDLAVACGPRAENNGNNNSDSVGVKIALLYTPKIIGSFFGYAEFGASTMRINEYQENGTAELSLNGNILSINTPVVREKNSYWKGSVNISAGIAYKF